MAPTNNPRPHLSARSVRRLLELARPQWRRLLLATVFLAIGSAANLVYPQGLRLILDRALEASDTRVIDQIAAGLLVLFLIQAIAIALRYYLFNLVGERVVADLRGALYASLLGQEMGFFDERRTGELTSRLSADTAVLQSAVSANISMALRNATSVLGGLVFLFLSSPALTGLMLLVVPPVAIGAVAYGRRVRRLSREVQDALAGASEVAEESLSGIRTVRSFAAEEHEVARYKSAVEKAFEVARRRARTASTFMGGASFGGYTAAAVVLWAGGRFVVAGQMSVGELASFLMYSMLVAFSLGALSDLWADLMRASGAAERVFELIDRQPRLLTSGARVLPAVRGQVALEQVSFNYPSRPDVSVLAEVNLVLEPGKVVALVGPSGAGKSTIASLLARFYDPTGGRILLDGHDLRSLEPTWLREQIGAVAQEPTLFSCSIAENLRYARPGASEADLVAAARAANAHDFIARFPEGYATLVGERGLQLSGGQKQRVAIARALLKDPRILILDEATSALDAESEHLVHEALERLMKGRTTLVIAHRLSTVMNADRVLVMDQGRVVQTGDHQSLVLQDGLYRRLVERQFVAA